MAEIVFSNSEGRMGEQIPCAAPVDQAATVSRPNPALYFLPSATYHTDNKEVVTEKPASMYHHKYLFIQFGNNGNLGSKTVPKKIRCSHLLGGTELDFSFARFIYSETKIYSPSVWGTLKVVVPLGVRVNVKNFGIFTGSKGLDKYMPSDINEQSPVLTIKGGGIFSKVRVTVNYNAPPLRVIE
mmetsp:Transcript_1990/g.2555  ORF Transcript_1990/g.2555 Transcript_1990/m.2555 type:complete len:184 (-) Transcript_1990:557-1108(-)